MRFDQIITEIRSFGDRQVDCKYMIVRSTYFFCDKNEEAIQLISQNQDPRNSPEARRRKQTAQLILEALRSGQGISEPFSPLPTSLGTIYPMKNCQE